MALRPDPRAEPEDEPVSDKRDVESSGGRNERDSLAVRAKGTPTDPRVEPETTRPVGEPSRVPSNVRHSPAPPAKNQANEVATKTSLRPVDSKRPSPADRAAVTLESKRSPPADRTSVTSVDPRLERIEPTIDAGNWQGVRTMLGSIEDAGRLPPTLGLIAAIAHSESAGEDGSPDASELAIRCMASLFAVGNGSPIGRVLAKRMLRKNPRISPQQSAPQTRASVAIVFIVLVAVAVVGSLVATGTIRIPH